MNDDERLSGSSKFQRSLRWHGILRPLLIATIFTTAIVAIIWHLDASARPPDREEIENFVSGEKTPGSQTLDYQILDSKPHLLFISKGYTEIYDKVILDLLVYDWSPNDFPFLPRWRLSDNYYYIEPTTAPASLGDAHCTGLYYGDCTMDTEVFGQINSREITTLELDLKGSHHRYPAFMLRLKGFRGLPDDYRWLDIQGRVVWTAVQDKSATGTKTKLPGSRSPARDWYASRPPT